MAAPHKKRGPAHKMQARARRAYALRTHMIGLKYPPENGRSMCGIVLCKAAKNKFYGRILRSWGAKCAVFELTSPAF